MKLAKNLVSVACAVAITISMAGCSSVNSGSKSSSKKSNIVIGFSDNYNGNSFHQCEEKALKQVGATLKSSGQIADYTIVEANNSAQTQISQIESLILKKVSAIIIDPSSPTALDGAISKAKAANIPVIIANDGPVDSTDCYQLVVNHRTMTRDTATWLCQKLNGKGNVLVLRGIAGTQSDKEYYDGMSQVFKTYPDIKIVGSVYGNWTNSIAQNAVASVLPSLPKVDGVEGEGGDAIGAMQAFQMAGKQIPILVGGNRGIFLKWWSDQLKKDPSFTDYSECVDPAGAAASMYLAVDIINGKKIPQNMVLPNIKITNDTLSTYTSITSDDVAMSTPTQASVRSILETQQSATLPLTQ